MSTFLKLSFLFFIGATLGWVLELFFRRATNREKKWINPGFCTGPYLPLYGFGLCLMYLLHDIPLPGWISNDRVVLLIRIFAMGLGATLLEYIAGLLCLKVFKVRLWDYSNRPGNIQGIICPLFTLFWILIAAVYCLFLHRHVLEAIEWLSHNLAYSFAVGMFFGVFLMDVANSAHLVVRLKQFAEENRVIIRFEDIKDNIKRYHTQTRKKYRFFLPFRSDRTMMEHLKEMRDGFEQLRSRQKK